MDAASEEPLVGANVLVKGSVIGTITNAKGNFKLITAEKNLPLTLLVSSPGYGIKDVTVSGPTNILIVRLEYQALLMGQELVVLASRVEESILESPVSIEKMDILDVRSAAAPSFYDQLVNLKGIDVSAQSLLFKTINPRGFGTNGNVRTVQLIDGIDNQAPSLNYPVSNIVGIPELDVESVELLPGAASALYGPNAINGIILMNSKSPFEYQGLSTNVKLGVNHVDSQDDDPSLYQSYGLRYARAFDDRFAFKVNGEFLWAADFQGVDYRDQQSGTVAGSGEDIDPINRADRRTYDGVNVYGDPLVNVGTIAENTPELAPLRDLLPSDQTGDFTPTGYTELQFIDNTTESIKLRAALHYRLNDEVEALVQYNFGTGNTVYTSNERLVTDGFTMQTAKAELRSSNFFLRAYTTQENSGDTYAASALASLINAQTTIPRYVQTFANARLQGRSVPQAHQIARRASDALRAENLANGRFQTLYDSLRATPISDGGATFLSRTGLWHYEGMYNFSQFTDVAEIIVGGNFRRYTLKSDGTVYALQDDGSEFTIDEWGTYAQISKHLLDKQLDVTASVRYDKNQNFDGQFSPRLSGVYTLNNHNIRASFQRGFRIPTTQGQFIDLNEGPRRTIGGNQLLTDRYNFETNQVYLANSVLRAQENFKNTQNVVSSVALLVPVTFKDFDTEKVSTYEVGYRGGFNNNLFIDGYYYYSVYTDFVAAVDVIQSAGPANDPDGDGMPPFMGEADPVGLVQGDIPGQRFGRNVNADGAVDVHGFAIGLDYVLLKDFTVGGNVAYNELLNQDDLLRQGLRGANYNTPKWRYNIQLTNRKVTDQVGFSLFWRWQSAFLWETAFGRGEIPAYQTLDAQLSYKLPELKTVLKLGGSNVLNKRYTTSFGNPRMGAVYYVSVTFDQFSN